MKKVILYRKLGARQNLDAFFVSAIASLLAVRFYLHLTDYPQIGGSSFHIAHMLWGGLLMLGGIAILLSFIGQRSQRVAAIVGGIGFGVFIDELGKFITRDNNYFYQPAIGIIYAVFIVLYLTFSFLSRSQKLTSREYQLNALLKLEEAILHDMDANEKHQARELLAKADSSSAITRQLTTLLGSIEPIPESRPPRLARLLQYLDARYLRFWHARSSRPMVQAFFIAQAVVVMLAIIVNNYRNLESIDEFIGASFTSVSGQIVGQFASAAAAAVFVVIGAVQLRKSRMHAFENFRRATLINIFLTEFFLFLRIQFEALPGLAFNIAVLLLLSYALRLEQRTAKTSRNGA